MIDLTYPWMLIALPLPWLVWRFMRPYKTQSKSVRIPFFSRLVDAAGVRPQTGATVVKKNIFQVVAGTCVWILLLLAATNPVYIGDPIEKKLAARDVMLAVDISGSMETADIVSDEGKNIERLAAVKEVLRKFIADRKEDRVGLIVFGSRAYVQVPFTQDLSAAKELLDSVGVGMAGPQTALGDAVGLAISTFERSDVEQRMLIILTDGSDTASRMTPLNAAAIAAQKDVKIFTIGIGNPDAAGEERVDFEVLREMAKKASGKFFTPDDQESLLRVYQEIDSSVVRETKTLSFRPEHSLIYWPTGIACMVILLSYLILLLRTRGKGVKHV
jgi:Ca-activated chloride channel family protein